MFPECKREVKRVNASIVAHIEDVDKSAELYPKSQQAAVNKAKDIDNLLSEHVPSPEEIKHCVEDLVRVDNWHTIQQFIPHDLMSQLQLTHSDMFEIACTNGALDTLKWMYSNWPDSTPTQANVDAALTSAQTGVVD